jgi:acyl-CoA thioesterase-2
VPDLLALERLDRDLFRNRINQSNANNALFGGQVLAQSLTAAMHTVESQPDARAVHSLHGYFLRAGLAHVPVIFQVDRTRDGGRFSTRRVIAIQNGEPIFHMECGFHAAEDGFDHQFELPAGTPDPDSLRNLAELVDEFGDSMPNWLHERLRDPQQPVEARPVHPEHFFHSTKQNARRSIWMRVPSGAGASATEQAAMLAWISDHWLSGTAVLPHVLPASGPDPFIASLDHAMWFHRPVQMEEWLLFDTESPSAQSGRGLSRGLIFARDGALVASVAQEALLRRRRAAKQ